MTRDQRIEVRVTAAEREAVRAAAEVLGRTVSDIIRRAVTDPTGGEARVPVLCDVCCAPRRSDPLADALAHAQCDQTIARLGQEMPDAQLIGEQL